MLRAGVMIAALNQKSLYPPYRFAGDVSDNSMSNSERWMSRSHGDSVCDPRYLEKRTHRLTVPVAGDVITAFADMRLCRASVKAISIVGLSLDLQQEWWALTQAKTEEVGL